MKNTSLSVNPTPRFIDLFAGCGGLSLGLMSAGLELDFAIEKSEMAAETFFHNFIRTQVTELSWFQYRDLSIQEQYKHKLIINQLKTVLDNKELMETIRAGNIDLVAGGPPCQGFSMAGRRDDTGLRISELVSLKIKDLHWMRATLK
jgi:DNA (cytosine-5)-methyltransferase 1